MNSETDLAMSERCENQGQRRGYGSFLVQGMWITSGVALLIVVLLLTLGRIRLSQMGREFLVAFVYSALIALPSIILLTQVSYRYSAQYPRFIILLQGLLQVCTAVAGCLVGDLLLQVMGIVAQGGYWREFRTIFPFIVVVSLVVGLSISVVETLRYRLQATVLELRTQQVEHERADKLLAEARLSSLESRIHPHFLFNTLNSIASLIPKDPQRAESMVGRLASLLRFSLNANPSGLVPLSQELKIVRDYLEIEKTRFGSRLRYEITVPNSLDSVKVPPLALQSLVENCVKHVVSGRPCGGEILIYGSMESGRILLEVFDDGPGFSLETISPEHGLGNLVARVKLLFGDGGHLEVSRKGERNGVRLSFPASYS